MEKSILTTIITALLCFLATFGTLKSTEAHRKQASFWIFWLVLFLSWITLYFIIPYKKNFITELYAWELPLLGIISSILYIMLKRYPKQKILLILLATEIGSFSLPTTGLLWEGDLSFWLDRATLIVLWTLYAYFFSWLNTTNGISGAQCLCIFGGISGLSLIGAAPEFLGIISFCGFSIFSAWQIFDTYPSKLKISNEAWTSIGFILGWLSMKVSTEGAGSCILCFNMFFCYQVAICIIRFFTLKKNYQNLPYNSDFYLVSLSGLSPKEIVNAIGKLQLLLVVLGGFAAFAPNVYSLPLFSLITCIWFFHRLQNWKESIPSLKEINATIVNDIKKSFGNGLKRKD